MTGRRVCCRGLGVQMLLVDSGGRRAPQQQHGAQQQCERYQRYQLTQEAEHRPFLSPSLPTA